MSLSTKNTNPATERQRAKLYELLLSSTFTAEEVTRTYDWMETPACTVEKCGKLIDKALARIKDRDQNRKDAEERQATAKQQKRLEEKAIERTRAEFHDRMTEQATPTMPTAEEQTEPKIYEINGKTYTDPIEAAEHASKLLFG